MARVLKIFLTSLFILLNSYSDTFGQVVINEISPNSNPNGYGDWIELYIYEDADLSNYSLTHLLGDGGEGNINIPEPYEYGPKSTNGEYKVISANNYLGNNGDVVRLHRQGVNSPVDQLPYGNEGGVCLPSPDGSIGRVDNANVVERFAAHSKGESNEGVQLDPCPTPTPTPTLTPTPNPTVTPKPTPVATKKPTLSPTVGPTVKAASTAKPTFSINSDKEGEDSDEIALGVRDKLTPTLVPGKDKEDKTKFPLAAGLFVLGGLSFIGAAAYPVIKAKKKSYTKKSEGQINPLS